MGGRKKLCDPSLTRDILSALDMIELSRTGAIVMSYLQLLQLRTYCVSVPW